jgi:phospholipid-translocating ATPase
MVGELRRTPTSMSKKRAARKRKAERDNAAGWWPNFKRKMRLLDIDKMLFERKRPIPAPRSVYFNEPLPADAFDKKGKHLKNWQFDTNQLLTARYTLYNFFFKNLYEQYHRVANMFFTLIVVLQFFPEFATISPGVAMLPLLVVLAVTMIKDGYEDWRRHISDRSINNAKVRVAVGGGWINPNITIGKQRSIKSSWNAFSDRVLGGRKKQQKKVLENEKNIEAHERPSFQAEPQEPPMTAPGGGAGQTHTANRSDAASSLGPESPALDRTRTSMSSMRSGSGLERRVSNMNSMSSYEHLPDGRIKHHGRQLNQEEEHGYWSKKAPRWRKQNWEDLRVGDFVLLKNNDPIPADIVVCSTSEEEDCCYIETKNLDGETNLKVRHAVPELAATIRNARSCTQALMRVDAEAQDTNMYRLNASVVLGERFDRDGQPLRCPITINEILLRGCNIRNTKWVIGLVLMTGADTKIIANSGSTPTKRGRVEMGMNPMVYVNLLILAAMAVGCAIADHYIETHFFNLAAYWEFFAIFSDDNPSINGLVTFGNSLITFQNIVPISLYISIEVVRTIQAYFIFDDYDIYYEKTNRRTIARSWNLADDLGQIQYIFSDKTGTLTQNLMIFREFNVGNVTYRGDEEFGQKQSSHFDEKVPNTDDSESGSSNQTGDNKSNGRVRVKPVGGEVTPFVDHKHSNALRDKSSKHAIQLGQFWRTLALCHTVVTGIVEGTGEIEFKAQSPDEQALVQAAADVGFVFCGKDRSTLKLQTPYSTDFEEYELLTVLEFSSARKRMSVILRRHSDDSIIVMTKGADSVIFERTAPGQNELKESTDQALEEFANKGLRTLCLGYKEITKEAYEAWAEQYHEASVSLTLREERMEDLADEMERELLLVGATGIEDRLQDGVPETIADLKRAGINVWVATGDKLETAIAIGYSTMLLSKDMNLIVVRGGEYGQPNSAYNQLRKAVEQFFGGEEAIDQMITQPPDLEMGETPARPPPMEGRRSTNSVASLVGENNGQRAGGYALVIDGTALGHALSEDFSRELLLDVSTQCRAVICCRVSPLQKALIVRLIRDGLGVMTLAIGDGANDVSMIQAAHVGVGIAGEEGLQAVNSSDYAIAQFRFLKRLLLVHGHWCYHRNGTMIINFFYKNWINIFCLFWFQIYCAWSSTQGEDYVYLLFWNSFWTVAAVIGFGIFDRILPDHVLMAIPELYERSRQGSYFNTKLFLIYLVDALWQSAVIYFIIQYSYTQTTSSNSGYNISLWEWSTVVAMAGVLVANVFIGMDARAWNWWIFGTIVVGPALIFIFAPIYAAFPPSLIWTYSYGNNYFLYRSAQFWFSGILVFFIALMPKFIWRFLRSTYFPNDIEIVRAIYKRNPNHDFVRDPGMPSLRAAKAYGVELPQQVTPTRTNDSSVPMMQQYPMSNLHPVTSRASSIQHDMLTGSRTPTRGYTFSAEDEPRRTQKRKGSIKNRLLPSPLRRTLEKRSIRRRLSTIRQGDGIEEGGDHLETEEGVASSKHPITDDPGPEEIDEDEENEEAAAAVTTKAPRQMNGNLGSNQ